MPEITLSVLVKYDLEKIAKMKQVLMALFVILPISVFAAGDDWNNYQSKGIPPHGKYTSWVTLFSEDGKQRTGFTWLGNTVSFGSYDEESLNDFDLSSRRDFRDYSAIGTYSERGDRFAATEIEGSDLSLVFRMVKRRILTAYLSDGASCEEYENIRITVNKTMEIEDICNIDHDLIKNAKTIFVNIGGANRKVSAAGSGASIIWLKSY